MKKNLNVIKEIFIDSSVYVQLTKKRNVGNMFDSLITYEPTFDKASFNIIFPGLSLLEAIGLGRIKETIKIFDQLNGLLVPLDDIDQVIKAPRLIFDTTFEILSKCNELCQEKLIEDIKKQRTYSASDATKSLVEKTLEAWLERFLNDPSKALGQIITELSWDITCCYSDKKVLDKIPLTEMHQNFHYALLVLWHKIRTKYNNDLSSYRIADVIIRTELLLPKHRKNVQKYHPKIYRIMPSSKLDSNHDLVDTSLIHYVTLGTFDSKKPVIAFTYDKKDDIEDRVVQQISAIKRLSGWSKRFELLIIPGVIYFLNNECSIIEKLDVGKLFGKNSIKVETNPPQEGIKQLLT